MYKYQFIIYGQLTHVFYVLSKLYVYFSELYNKAHSLIKV